MYKSIVRPVLFRFNSDFIHESTIDWASKISDSVVLRQLLRKVYGFQSPKLKQKFLGLTFRNPVGLAAGFDKNGTMIPVMEDLGFGFVEVGSITSEASAGNPKPRTFRLPDDLSLINRMGLNNDGAATVTKRLNKVQHSIPVGVNIAKTHNPEIEGDKALEDYFNSFQLAKSVADYITLNISCPNTKDGKTFENPSTLDKLLKKLQIGSDATNPPVLIKFSVDVDKSQLHELIEVARMHSISGYIATNTSTHRPGLTTSSKTLDQIGPGGLSGKGIRTRSNEIIRSIYEKTRGEKLIIGVGGVFDVEDVLEKIKAGADLVQVYTGLIYEGPALVRRINRDLIRYLNKNNLKRIYQIRKD
ncbi:MAG: quinone-dependent dihydroorotate dehydrogenase [Balneolaceae bacterium]